MDIYKEYLVKKKTSHSDIAKIIAAILGLLIIATAMFMYVPPSFVSYGLFIIAAGIFGIYKLVQYLNVEYEYIFTNGDLDFDKIMGQAKRKRLITVDFNTLSAFGALDSETAEKIMNSDYTVVDASDNTDVNDYYLECKHKTHGMTYVVFTPSEEFAEELEKNLPRNLKQ